MFHLKRKLIQGVSRSSDMYTIYVDIWGILCRNFVIHSVYAYKILYINIIRLTKRVRKYYMPAIINIISYWINIHRDIKIKRN